MHLCGIHRGHTHELFFHKELEVFFETLQIGVLSILMNIFETIGQRFQLFFIHQAGTVNRTPILSHFMTQGVWGAISERQVVTGIILK